MAQGTGVDWSLETVLQCRSSSHARLPQDKLRQKQFFAAAGVPVADFRGIENAGDLAAAAAEFGFPFMLKSRM